MTMPTTRRFEATFAATTLNVTSAELQVAPGPGAVAVWAGSSVNDSLITIRIGANIQSNRQVISNRGAAATIETEQQAPDGFAIVNGGEQIIVDITEATAMLARIIVIWMGSNLGAG